MTSPFNPELGRQLFDAACDNHNAIARKLRGAILDALAPDPDSLSCIEDRQEAIQAMPGFMSALANTVSELIDWDRGHDQFSQMLREWCDDETSDFVQP